jgi:dienelactone hydrolase
VQTSTVTLIDKSRPTDATAVTPRSSQRVLVTTITYPARKRNPLPLPLIVLAHGNDGHPRKFTQLIGAWAAAGYVVAAPAFPLTNSDTPGGSVVGDYVHQPADVSFVIDRVLAMGRDRKSPIHGLVDKKHIGVAGLSLGGGTVYGLVFNTCCIDTRVDAVILMSAIRLSFPNGMEDWRHVPALMLHGDADPLYPISKAAYPLLATPKWFVTLHGSSHSGPFENSPDPADIVVPKITIAFWDRYLKGETSAEQRLLRAVNAYPNASLERALQ